MRRGLTIVLAVLGVVILGWFALTCAGKIEAPATITSLFQSAPAPTPLPAYPAGTMSYPPSAGEPPVGVFSNDELEEFDRLPVGAGMPPAEEPDSGK